MSWKSSPVIAVNSIGWMEHSFVVQPCCLSSRDMVIVAWEWVREYLWLCFASINVLKVCHKLGCIREVVAKA